MSILIGDRQLSPYRIKKMIDTNDKFEATKLRGWHGFWKNILHVNWFGTKEREQKLEKFWSDLHSDILNNTQTPKNNIDRLIIFNKIRLLANDNNLIFSVFIIKNNANNHNIVFKINGITILKKTTQNAAIDVEKYIIENSIIDHGGKIKNNLSTEFLQKVLHSYNKNNMLTALMLNFNFSITQEQETELENLWSELHNSSTSKNTIDALITFNKIRMITNSANNQSPNNQIFNVSCTNDRHNVEFKIGGFVILKKPVTDIEAYVIKSSTNPYGQIKNDLTFEAVQQALYEYIRKPLVDIINELNASADKHLTKAQKTQKEFKDMYNNTPIIKELALFKVDYPRVYNFYNESQKFTMNSAIDKILGKNIEKNSDNISDYIRFAALKKLNINDAHAAFEQCLTDEERCLLLSATQSLGVIINSKFFSILHEAGLEGGGNKKTEEDRKTEITADGFIWTISNNYSLINKNNDNKQILGKYKITVEVEVTKKNNITEKTIKKISYFNEF